MRDTCHDLKWFISTTVFYWVVLWVEIAARCIEERNLCDYSNNSKGLFLNSEGTFHNRQYWIAETNIKKKDNKEDWKNNRHKKETTEIKKKLDLW